MISTKDKWQEFNTQKEVIQIKKNLEPIIHDVLRQESILSLNELENIIKEYNQCPVVPVFHSIKDGDLITELLALSNKLVASALSY